MRGRDRRSAGAVLVLLAVALIAVAGVSAWQGATRLAGRADERERLAATARAFVEAYGTFDYRHPDATRPLLEALTTGDLREAVVGAAPDPVALAQQRVSVVRVRAVQVTALSPREATATLTAEQARRDFDPTTGAPLVLTVHQQVVCRLVRESGIWRVAELRVVAETPPTDQATR